MLTYIKFYIKKSEYCFLSVKRIKNVHSKSVSAYEDKTVQPVAASDQYFDSHCSTVSRTWWGWLKAKIINRICVAVCFLYTDAVKLNVTPLEHHNN